MDVKIITFPETRVAAVEHRGPPSLEYDSSRKLIAWKLKNGLLDQSLYRSYGVHYTDPRTTPPAEHRVDFCLSVYREVTPNEFGVVNKVIPRCRCAVARHLGSRTHNAAAAYLYEQWLPRSGEMADNSFPIFFHYVNVGPQVTEEEMVTDVYLPLK